MRLKPLRTFFSGGGYPFHAQRFTELVDDMKSDIRLRAIITDCDDIFNDLINLLELSPEQMRPATLVPLTQ